MAKLRVGISGWRYSGWRGDFYPKGLPQKRELEFAAAHFDSVEINGSFYSLQRPESYASWAAQTPPDFVFSVKGSRYITHLLKLRNVEVALANFFASGLLGLGRKLGPILWQFPAQLGFDGRFAEFIERLPRDTEGAAELAERHDRRLRGRSLTRCDARRRLRHAFEVRSPSFLCPDYVALLRRHRVAAVVADTAGRWPAPEDVTADFVYVRLHGDVKLYESGYGPAAIERWAQRVRAWGQGNAPKDSLRASPTPARARQGRDVYVYFDNDAKVRAPYDAIALRAALGLTPRLPAAPLGLRARASRGDGGGEEEEAATAAAPSRVRARHLRVR
jgi:uncharacterized protein YecE (DUF72 family)